ncbi:MAG: OB-fold nucleic acid binding domain-containing protein [archaeon]
MIERKAAFLALILASAGTAMLYAIPQGYGVPHTPIQKITPSYEGVPVVVSGSVSQIKSTEKVTLLTLSDGEASILVPVFDKAEEFSIGEALDVSGKVQLYNGALEVIPSAILRAPPAQEKNFVSVSEIGASWESRSVRILGKVVSSKEYKDSQLISVEDHTGKIDVYTARKYELWNGDYVSVDGTVSMYKGMPEVKATSIERL